MATRKYEQRLRAENAELTRRRILDAVGQQLRESPTEQLSLDKVARVARVSRSTIYTGFGSRAGLLDAFIVDLWKRTGLQELTDAVETPNSRQHLRNAVAAASRMQASELDTYRALHAMDRLDPSSAGDALSTMERDRLGGVEHLARRLADDGNLRDDVDLTFAIDVLWTITSFESLDLLITGRHLSVDQAIERLTTTAERTLCAP